MDPFLEGHLWPDVHHGLATEIRRRLAPRLKPRYVARIEIHVIEDESPEAEIGIMYPDVEVLAAQRRAGVQPKRPGEEVPDGLGPSPAMTPPLTIPMLKAVEVKVASVEIRDTAGNELITTIDILSPVNKREPGLGRYREKRRRLIENGVHLLEIDLLRRGIRPLASHPKLPASTYLVTLSRAGAPRVEVWPVGLSDTLPNVPVPLRDPDPDVPLELSAALSTVYADAAYELSIDYRQPPPPPPLSPDEERWWIERFQNR